jgi:hypothetical protein
MKAEINLLELINYCFNTFFGSSHDYFDAALRDGGDRDLRDGSCALRGGGHTLLSLCSAGIAATNGVLGALDTDPSGRIQIALSSGFSSGLRKLTPRSGWPSIVHL